MMLTDIADTAKQISTLIGASIRAGLPTCWQTTKPYLTSLDFKPGPPHVCLRGKLSNTQVD